MHSDAMAILLVVVLGLLFIISSVGAGLSGSGSNDQWLYIATSVVLGGSFLAGLIMLFVGKRSTLADRLAEARRRLMAE